MSVSHRYPRSVLWSGRHWSNDNLLTSKMLFDRTSTSLSSLSLHPTSYSLLILTFRALRAWNAKGQSRSQRATAWSPWGQEPGSAEGQGSKLTCWWDLERKRLWAVMLGGLWKLKFRTSFWLWLKGGGKFKCSQIWPKGETWTSNGVTCQPFFPVDHAAFKSKASALAILDKEI